MTYQFSLREEPFASTSQLAYEKTAAEWEGETHPNSRDYIRWVQQSLNRIMRLRLAEDGVMGPQTRSAIRSFQERQGLYANGNVDSQTEATIKAALTSLSTSPTQVPSVPTGPATTPSSLPIPLFQPKPADPLITDPKMQLALRNAIAELEKYHGFAPGTFPVRFSIADVTDPSGSFPSAGYLENVTDYTASEAKVAVMYSAYALRDMVRRFAVSNGANAGTLFALLSRRMDPLIIKASRNVARAPIGDIYRVPTYREVFEVMPVSSGYGVDVAFTPGFSSALEAMIVPSDNAAAAACIHGVGYGYLNGALSAGGFFDPVTNQGLWVAGDFLGRWPYIRINSRNDSWVAQAGTSRDMAKLVSLIMTDRLLDPTSCREMRQRLANAATGPDTPWVARTRIFNYGTITHNKLGLGPLKSGKNVWSEVSVYRSPVTTGRRYVVAWQNLVGPQPIGFEGVAKIIRATISGYER